MDLKIIAVADQPLPRENGRAYLVWRRGQDYPALLVWDEEWGEYDNTLKFYRYGLPAEVDDATHWAAVPAEAPVTA